MKKMTFPKLTFKRPSLGGIIFWVISIGLGVATLVFARGFFACWTITNLPGMAPASCGASANSGPVFNPQGTPIATGVAVTPEISAPVDIPAPTWDGGSRVNVLFIGIDARDINESAPRSDTMILFTMDPISKTAGMLSIPRDMWVNIPGSGYGRINTAYSIGAGAKLPGGGPGLAMQTVSQFLGVPVNYYAQVDFNTFIAMIDTIGGVDVQVKERLVLDPVGTGKDKVVITPGDRHLVGWKALAYARIRKTESGRGDVDRAQRQQDVIFAIMNKVFSPDYFPTFIKQAPGLYTQMSAGIHTNLSLEDGVRLAALLQGIPRASIKTGVIGYDMVIMSNTTLDGQNASVFKPKPDDIRILRDEIFGGGAVSQMARNEDPLVLMKQENARIRINNGTFTPDFGQRTATYLQGLGLNVMPELTSSGPYDRTVIVLYSPKLYTMSFLLYLFDLNSASGTWAIRFEPTASPPVDVEIRLGNDVANTNRIP
jgi:LCP family protein required for cell wall assembly